MLSGVESVTGRLVNSLASRCFSALFLRLQGVKPFLSTTVLNLPYAAFQSLGGIHDATQAAGVPQTALQRETEAAWP